MRAGTGVDVGVGVAVGSPAPQKPPARLNAPPACAPASAWPTVPPRLYAPPVLNVPPPPSNVFHERSKPPATCAMAGRATAAKTSNPTSTMPIRPSRNNISVEVFILLLLFFCPGGRG